MQKILDQIEILIAAYPNFRPDNPEQTARVYIETFRNYDPETFAIAVNRLIRNSPFFPTIYELNQAYDQQVEWQRMERSSMKLKER